MDMTHPGCGFALKFLFQTQTPLKKKKKALKTAVFANTVIFYWSCSAVIKSPSNRVNKQSNNYGAVWKLSLSLESVKCTFSEKTFFTSSDLVFLLPARWPILQKWHFFPLQCETDESIWHQGLFGICVCTWGEYSTSVWLWVVKVNASGHFGTWKKNS